MHYLFIIIALLLSSMVCAVHSIDLPEDLKIPDENEDYKIKIANNYLKCLNKYVNCDYETPYLCDDLMIQCLFKKTKKHLQIIAIQPTPKDTKIVIEEIFEDD